MNFILVLVFAIYVALVSPAHADTKTSQKTLASSLQSTDLLSMSRCTANGGCTPGSGIGYSDYSISGQAIMNAASSGMVYPSAGIPNSTGTAWGNSYSTSGTGNIVLTSGAALTGATINGVSLSNTGSASAFLNGAGAYVAPAWSMLTGTPTTLSGYGITDAVSSASPVLSGITGSTQCLHVNSSGVVTGTGSDCGSGGGSGITALTGDVAASGTGSVSATLATVNTNVGSFGSATQAPTLTVNAKGLVTAAGVVTMTPAFSSITSKPTTISGYGITDTISQALTGFTAGAGTVSSSDTILSAFNKLVGNVNALVTGTSSVFGRSGAVTAQSGDYTVSQVTGAAPIVAPTFTTSATSPFFAATGTGADTLPVGTTGQRPTGAVGMLRYNSTTNAFEGYQGASPAWASLSGGGTTTIGTTAVAPSPASSASATTGIYSTGATQVGIAINSTPEIGIGTTGVNIPTMTTAGLVANDASGNLTTLVLNKLCGVSTFTIAQCNAFFGFVRPEWYGALGNGGFYFDGAFSVPATSAWTNGSSTTPTTPAVTTVTANDLVVSLFATASAWSAAPSAGTTRVNLAYSSPQYGMFASDQLMATAGTTTAISGTTSGSAGYGTASIALAPSGGSVTYVASSTYQSATTNTVTLSKPTGTTSGDYLLACMYMFDFPASQVNHYIRVPSGWAAITTGGFTNHNWLCYGKNAGASEPSSYAWNFYLGSANASGVMIDYRNTSGVDGATNTLTSATAAFTSSAVNDPICVAGLNGDSTNQLQICGTISSYNSATSVGLSFYVPRNLSGLQFSYGTDDTSAITTMTTTAPCSTKGCHIKAGPVHYVMTSGIALPKNVPVKLEGATPSLPNTANSTPAVNANNGTMFNFLSQTMTSAGLSVSGSLHLSSTVANDVVRDISLYGGAGTGMDGPLGDGIDALNWQGALFDDVYVANFSGLGAYVDGLAASNYLDYSENIFFDHSYLTYNATGGLKVGSSTAVYNVESTQFTNGIIEVNGGPNVILAGSNIQGFLFSGNTMQWGNLFSPNTEWVVSGNVLGGIVESNYFETDGNAGSLSTALFGNTQGMLGLTVRNNYYTGGYTPQVFSAAGTALPTCTTGNLTNLASAIVSDATTCVSGKTYASGGSTQCAVNCIGGNWVEGGIGAPNYSASATTLGIGTATPQSTLSVNGNISTPYTTISTSTTLLASYKTVYCNATSGAVVLTLPTAASFANGTVSNDMTIVKTDSSANACTITPQGSSLIKGQSTLALTTQGNAANITSDATNFWAH